MGTSEAEVIRRQAETIRQLRKTQERLTVILSAATGFIGFLASGYVERLDPEVAKTAMDRCAAYRKVIQEVKGGRG